jgi:hypothetical protein
MRTHPEISAIGLFLVTMCVGEQLVVHAIQRRQALPQDPMPVPRVRPRGTRPSMLKLEAVGTLGDRWVAIAGPDLVRPYRLGDSVEGARIENIERSLVTLREGNALTYLEVVDDIAPVPCREAPMDVFTCRRDELDAYFRHVAAHEALSIRDDLHGCIVLKDTWFTHQLGIGSGSCVQTVGRFEAPPSGALTDLWPLLGGNSVYDVELRREGRLRHLHLEVQMP